MNSRTRKKVRARNRQWKEIWEQSRLTREIDGAFEPTMISAPWLIEGSGIGKPAKLHPTVTIARLEKNTLGGKVEMTPKPWEDHNGVPLHHKPQASTLHAEKGLDKPLPWNYGDKMAWEKYCIKENEREARALAMKTAHERAEAEREALLAQGIFVPRHVVPIEAEGLKKREPRPKAEKPAKAPKIKVTVVHSRDHASTAPIEFPATTKDKFFIDKGRAKGYHEKMARKVVAAFFTERNPIRHPAPAQ